MKKLFLFLISVIMLAGMVSAANNVEYSFLDKNGNGLNNVAGLAMVCQDSNCDNVNIPSTFGAGYDSAQSNKITIPYPINLENSNGYAVYFYKFGYLPYELAVDYAGNGDSVLSKTLLKGENCKISISSLDVNGFENGKQANIIAKGLSNNLVRASGAPNFIPNDYKESYYGLNSKVMLTVTKDNSIVFTQEKSLNSVLNIQNEAAFTYTPSGFGNYNVQVKTFVDDVKCSSTVEDKSEKQIVLSSSSINQIPAAIILAGTATSNNANGQPVNAQVNQAVYFDGSLSTDDKGVVSYSWDFGDNNFGNNAQTTHAYAAAGNYIAKLTVTDAQGLTHTSSVNVVVTAALAGNQAPVASALVGTTISNSANSQIINVNAGQVVYFESLSTDDKAIVSYFWDFGDNSNDNKFSTQHVYSAVGQYTIILTVRDAEGLADTKQFTIKVNPKDTPITPADFDVVETKLEIFVIRDSTSTSTINIVNPGVFDMTGFGASAVFNSTVSGRITASLSTNTAAAGKTTPFILSVNADDNTDIDTYSGNLIISRAGKQRTIAIVVYVLPDICEAGSDLSSFKVTIKSPKTGNDFKPGQIMKIEADVRNEHGKDLDVGTTAELWNIKTGNVLASVDSDVISIDKNDKETFEMELEVPNSDDVNEQDDLVLFVRAYEDGNEGELCSYEGKNLDVKRKTYDIMITDFTATPSALTCSQKQVGFKVGLENIGTKKDDSVEINIKNDELGLSLSDGPFTLKKFDETDNSVLRSFTYTLPNDVSSGTYDVVLEAKYNDDKDSATMVKQITVADCSETSGLTPDLYNIFNKQNTQSNEQVSESSFISGLLRGDSLMSWALVLGIILVLLVIIYAVKVLAR